MQIICVVAMEIVNKPLFLKYAIPCAETLKERGDLTEEDIEKLTEIIKENKEIPADSEKPFKVALAMCSYIAMREGKREIDEEVIRRYFLYEHDKAIDQRFQEMGDFDPEACRTYPGKVAEVKEKTIFVRTPKGVKEYRNDFIRRVKKGDLVVVHRDFVIEKIDGKIAGMMLHIKGLSPESLK
jgi:hydrogenase maturation factor